MIQVSGIFKRYEVGPMGSRTSKGPYHLLSSLAMGRLLQMLVASSQTKFPGVKFSLSFLWLPLLRIMSLLASIAALALSRDFDSSDMKLFTEGLIVSVTRFPFHGWSPYVRKNGVFFVAE